MKLYNNCEIIPGINSNLPIMFTVGVVWCHLPSSSSMLQIREKHMLVGTDVGETEKAMQANN